MIKSLEVAGFKCFVDNKFDFGKLTILSGINASGKTSLLHSLALLHQSACENNNLEKLILNGPVLKLGRASDVLHKSKAKDLISFKIRIEPQEIAPLEWSRNFQARDREDFILYRKTSEAGKDAIILQALKGLTYLSADRLGPREMHDLDASDLYPTVGVRGEYAISRLLKNENETVLPQMRMTEVPPTLFKQVQAYMGLIFPGFKFESHTVSGSNVATLSLAICDSIGFVRPQNIGFGLSYALAIFIACLSAKEEDVLIIENPEAHLHPLAQSLMGEFLARVSASGVQLLLETHSDHLLNGVRKAVKALNHPIKAEDVKLYFFDSMKEDDSVCVATPTIDSNGKISDWPKGFFDQYDNDLEALIDW